jgi:hypothetical protein
VTSTKLKPGQLIWFVAPGATAMGAPAGMYYCPITAATDTSFSWQTTGVPDGTYADRGITISSWPAIALDGTTGMGNPGKGGSFMITSPDRFQEIRIDATASSSGK